MPVPDGTPALFLGRAVFDKAKFRKDTDPEVINCLARLADTLKASGWPSPAKTGDADIKMAVFAEDDGGGGHLLWGGNPADPLSPVPITVSASGSATVIWQEEGSTVKTSGTVNFVGAGATVTDEGDGKATVTIPGGGGGSTDSVEIWGLDPAGGHTLTTSGTDLILNLKIVKYVLDVSAITSEVQDDIDITYSGGTEC